MRTDLARAVLLRNLLGAPTLARRTAGRPGPQRAEAPRVLLADQRRLGVAAELLGVGERADRRVEVPQRGLGIGVDLLAVAVRQVLRGRVGLPAGGGRGGADEGLARRGRREVSLADGEEVGVEAGDEGGLVVEDASC